MSTNPVSRRFIAFGLMALVSIPLACKPHDPPNRAAAPPDTAASPDTAAQPDSATPPADDLAPIDVVRELHAARWSGRHAAMQEQLVAEQRAAVLDLVLAVDQLIAAEGALQEAVRQSVGHGSAERFRRRTQVANIIGPLSRDVQFVDEHIDGDQAVVTIQVADRVPLERVDVVRESGRWCVRTDEPIPGLVDALRDLADSTRRFAGEVRRLPADVDTIERELNLRQAPILRRMASLVENAEVDPADH